MTYLDHNTPNSYTSTPRIPPYRYDIPAMRVIYTTNMHTSPLLASSVEVLQIDHIKVIVDIPQAISPTHSSHFVESYTTAPSNKHRQYRNH